MAICDPYPQTPQDLENQLAGPGGHFPGTAETLATPVGSDKPVRVKIGQADNRHLQLSREEYRARSARQREIDDQTDPIPNPTAPPEPQTDSVRMPPPNPPGSLGSGLLPAERKKRGRPKGAKNKSRPAGTRQEKLIGQPSLAPSTTAAPVPPIPIPTDAMLEQRMSRLEQGMDMIVQAIAQRDERAELEIIDVVPNYDGTGYTSPDCGHTAPMNTCCQDAAEAFAELDEELEDDLDEPGAGPGSMVVTDVDRSAKTVTAVRQAKDEPELDAGLQALQQMILKRNPQKVFRQYWAQLTRLAQYNEWPPERREAFDEVFNSMVAHPKFVHQMSTFLRGSRSGNCVGNEQIARVCGMVAGFLTVYQLAAAGR